MVDTGRFRTWCEQRGGRFDEFETGAECSFVHKGNEVEFQFLGGTFTYDEHDSLGWRNVHIDDPEVDFDPGRMPTGSAPLDLVVAGSDGQKFRYEHAPGKYE